MSEPVLKLASDQSANRTPVEPLNDKQAEYMSAITNGSCIICTGVLGSSKTYIPSAMAAEYMHEKIIKRIIVARPAEGAGKPIGFTPGTKDEKLAGWCKPVLTVLKDRLGIKNFEELLEQGKIELLALDQCKGDNWDNAFVIIDEAEDLSVDVAKNLVTRQGQNSTVVICGDVAQQDIKKYSGLQYLLDAARFNQYPPTLIDFDSWDYCVRGPEAKGWGMAFEAMDRFARDMEKKNGK